MARRERRVVFALLGLLGLDGGLYVTSAFAQSTTSFSLSPSTLAYSATVGSPNKSGSVTVTNTGSTALTVTWADSINWFVATTGVTQTIQPGQSATFAQRPLLRTRSRILQWDCDNFWRRNYQASARHPHSHDRRVRYRLQPLAVHAGLQRHGGIAEQIRQRDRDEHREHGSHGDLGRFHQLARRDLRRHSDNGARGIGHDLAHGLYRGPHSRNLQRDCDNFWRRNYQASARHPLSHDRRVRYRLQPLAVHAGLQRHGGIAEQIR